MAFNTKSIVKDINQKPVPQIFSPNNDAYEVVQGEHGASRVMVYDVNGNPVDLVNLVASIVTAINTTGTTQLRTGTNAIGTVKITESALPTGGSIESKQDVVIGHVDGIEGLLDTVSGKVATSIKQDELKTVMESIKNTDNTKTHYVLSTDTKPTSGNSKGDKCFEINTGEVFMFNGNTWVVI